MKKLLFVFAFLFLTIAVNAQKIQWVTWQEAIELSKTQQKKIFVDVYTEWCGYCKKLDNTTLSNPSIVEYVNETYYAIKFDAEMKEDVTLNGKTYSYVSSGKRGYHELAKEILKGQMSYPTLVFLDESFFTLQPIKGFQDVKTMNQILHFFGGDHHKNTSWIQFTQLFNNGNVRYDNNALVPIKQSIKN